MKKSKKLIWGLIILSAIVVLIFYNQGFTVPSTALPSGSYISVPTYGALRCEEFPNVDRSPQSGFTSFDKVTITCKNTGNNLIQRCDVNFKLPSESEIGSKTDVKNSCLVYRKCTSGESCNLEFGKKVCVRELFINKEENIGDEFTETLNENQFIYAEYQQSSPFGSVQKVNKGKYAINFKPYKIARYDVFSQSNANYIGGYDCKIASSTPEVGYAIKSMTSGLSKKLQPSEVLDTLTLQKRGAVLNYISNFVAIVPQYQLFPDGNKYCYDKKIYRVDEVSTTNGVYKVANTNINEVEKTVECCNQGDVPTGYTCKDFKQVKLSTTTTKPTTKSAECNALNVCPINSWTSAPNKQMIIQECVGGQCVAKTKNVACSYNEDCPSGNCIVDKDNPENNKCEFFENTDFCGNGLCEESKGENFQECPKDCNPNLSKSFNYIPILIIGGFLIAAIVIIIIAKKKRRI